ncbi:hypothetical protein, partial [Streptomyces sp. JJ66]|uniref:hypothetical protein n=1 Tax=Streptomyces sp. JJ66 TaxID=2803843 RepID=UPI001C5A538B
ARRGLGVLGAVKRGGRGADAGGALRGRVGEAAVVGGAGLRAAVGVSGRTVAEGGFGEVPLLRPLEYPGRVVTEAVLLDGDELVPWRAGAGGAGTAGRVPVVAVGSNAAPAQVRYKLALAGVPGPVPMVPVRVAGLAVGHSGHVSVAGYVAYAPYPAPGRQARAVLLWLDAAQLAVVDASERFNYRRVRLPAERFPVYDTGGAVDVGQGAYVYAGSRGLLADADRAAPRAAGSQHAVLGELLERSRTLRELFGGTPREWVERVREDHRVCARGTAVLRAEGWVLDAPEW